MKRSRPVRHYRVVKTKKGKKKVLVNKNIIRKPRKKKKSSPSINPPERRIFKFISNPDNFRKEFGGAIDFDKKGKIENINLVPGETYNVTISPDYEVQYHTHPDKDMSPPSPEDIIALLDNKNQQAELIFRNGEGFLILKSRKAKALSKLPATQLYDVLDKAFNSSIEAKDWENEYKKELEKLGFIVYINKNQKRPFNINIKPMEPERRKR